MDTIEVAVDGSKHSEKVVDFAISLARSLSAKILLVNVPPDFSIPEGYSQYVKAEGADPASYYEELSQGVLDRFGDRVRAAKVPCEAISGAGPVTKFVLDTAASRGASIIVLGVHGLHRIRKIRALGSNARRILENADVPVVAVP